MEIQTNESEAQCYAPVNLNTSGVNYILKRNYIQLIIFR